jgi:hypothetical protein
MLEVVYDEDEQLDMRTMSSELSSFLGWGSPLERDSVTIGDAIASLNPS